MKWMLYIISLIPLFILVFIKTISFCHISSIKDNVIPFICFIFSILGFLFYGIFKFEWKGGYSETTHTVIEVENINPEQLTFLATYILPFITLDFNRFNDQLASIFILITIGLIYVKTNMFYTNPTLALFGFHIYKIKKIDGENIIAISIDKISENDVIVIKNLSDNVFYVRVKK